MFYLLNYIISNAIVIIIIKEVKGNTYVEEKKARKFLKRVVLVNIEEGIWWQVATTAGSTR